MIKLQTVYIPTKVEDELPDTYESQFELIANQHKNLGWFNKNVSREHMGATHWLKPTEAFVFTPEELKQVLSNAWNDGRNGTEFTGNFPFTSNRYVNHSPEEYIENFLNK